MRNVLLNYSLISLLLWQFSMQMLKLVYIILR